MESCILCISSFFLGGYCSHHPTSKTGYGGGSITSYEFYKEKVSMKDEKYIEKKKNEKESIKDEKNKSILESILKIKYLWNKTIEISNEISIKDRSWVKWCNLSFI